MADTLLIHFNPEHPDAVVWALVNIAGELSTMLAHGSLDEAALVAEKHNTVILLDSTAIHIDVVKLPIRNPQKLLRAAPFALEEKIADDIDDLHFITGRIASDGATPVLAIRHDILGRILEQLEQSGIVPMAIIPDTLCLTASPTQWAILLDDERAKVQFDQFDAGEFDRDMLALLLKAELKKATRQPPEKLILFTPDGDDSETDSILAVIPEQLELVKVSYNTHPLVIYCGQYRQALSLNLLQNTYKPKPKVNQNWQRWRLPAALAAVWLGLHLAVTGVQYYEYQGSNEKLQVEIESLYKKTFPQSQRIVNAQVQMEQKLDELKAQGNAGSDASLISLLAAASNALSSEQSVAIQSINYRRNTLDIEVTAANLQNIEQLNKKLNNADLSAEILTSSSAQNQVKGSIRIKRAQSS